jgi:hypothetical protein
LGKRAVTGERFRALSALRHWIAFLRESPARASILLQPDRAVRVKQRDAVALWKIILPLG